ARGGARRGDSAHRRTGAAGSRLRADRPEDLPGSSFDRGAEGGLGMSGSRHLLITGGAGFIGSHLVDLAMARPGTTVTVLDKLTYAGDRENLADHEGDPRFR